MASPATSRCCGVGGDRRRARLPRAVVRGRRPDLRAGRADRPGHALLGRRAAGRCPSSAAPNGCARSSASARPSRTSPRSCSSCTRRAAGARATPSRDDTPWQAEMEASFPYEETVDQLRAVAEVKADMERVRPMDRLVVGDVGYGKTEVALRAAFKATQDGKQVAVLVPDDRPRRPAPRDVQPALRRVPARGPAAVAVRVGEGPGGHARRARRRAPSTSSSGRTGCSARTSGSRTSGWSSSTRSSGSASRPRSGSSGSAARSTS